MLVGLFFVQGNKMLIGFSDELASVLPAIRAISVFTGVKLSNSILTF